jgi:hypothetical protein
LLRLEKISANLSEITNLNKYKTMNTENTNAKAVNKTAVISSFFKDISLEEYLKYGGNIDNINISKTFTRYGDENEKRDVKEIKYSHINKKSKSLIYKVTFKNGNTHDYSGYWISTLVSFRLSESYL